MRPGPGSTGARRAPGPAYLAAAPARPGLRGQLWGLQGHLTELHRVWTDRGARLRPAVHKAAARAPRANVCPPPTPERQAQARPHPPEPGLTVASGRATSEQLLLQPFGCRLLPPPPDLLQPPLLEPEKRTGLFTPSTRLPTREAGAAPLAGGDPEGYEPSRALQSTEPGPSEAVTVPSGPPG